MHRRWSGLVILVNRSNSQDKVEISHSNMFNLFPRHTLHLDFCEFNNKDYILIVDRMIGYIGADQTINQGIEAAISAVKNWSTLFGYPYRIISDSVGAFRKTFKVPSKNNGMISKGNHFGDKLHDLTGGDRKIYGEEHSVSTS